MQDETKTQARSALKIKKRRHPTDIKHKNRSAGLPKTVGQRFYSEETRLINFKQVANDLATMAISIGIYIISFAENEFFFDNENKSNSICTTLRVLNSVLICLNAISVYRHYEFELQILKATKMVLKETNILKSHLRWKFLSELLLTLIITPPYLDYSVSQHQLGRFFSQSLDSYIFVIATARFHIFIRIYTHLTYYTGERANRVCQFNGFSPSAGFAMRAYLKTSAFTVLAIGLFSSIILFGLAVRAFERPFTVKGIRRWDFDYITNSWWCMAVTMTTIGYGDIYALTHFGRLTTIIACIVGIFILSMIVVALNNYINLRKGEEDSFVELTKKKLIRDKLEKDSIELIQQFFKMKQARKNPLIDPREKTIIRIEYVAQFNRFKVKRRNLTYQPPDIKKLIDDTYKSFEKLSDPLKEMLAPIKMKIQNETVDRIIDQTKIHFKMLRVSELGQSMYSLMNGRLENKHTKLKSLDKVKHFYNAKGEINEKKDVETQYEHLVKIMDLNSDLYQAKASRKLIL